MYILSSMEITYWQLPGSTLLNHQVVSCFVRELLGHILCFCSQCWLSLWMSLKCLTSHPLWTELLWVFQMLQWPTFRWSKLEVWKKKKVKSILVTKGGSGGKEDHRRPPAALSCWRSLGRAREPSVCEVSRHVLRVTYAGSHRYSPRKRILSHWCHFEVLMMFDII